MKKNIIIIIYLDIYSANMINIHAGKRMEITKAKGKIHNVTPASHVIYLDILYIVGTITVNDKGVTSPEISPVPFILTIY